MFAAGSISAASARSWKTVSIPRSRASCGVWMSTGLPPKRISPLSGGCTPTSVLTSVLLPAPLSPTSATTSCGYTVKLTPRRACTRPKLLTTSRASSTGSGMAQPPLPSPCVIAHASGRLPWRPDRAPHRVSSSIKRRRRFASQPPPTALIRNKLLLRSKEVKYVRKQSRICPASAPRGRPANPIERRRPSHCARISSMSNAAQSSSTAGVASSITTASTASSSQTRAKSVAPTLE